MQKNALAFLETLMVTPSPSGYEQPAQQLMRERMKPFADKNVLTQSLLFRATDMIVEVNPRDIPQIEGDDRFNLYPYNALSYTFFGHNHRNPDLGKKEVRQAISHAINRQEMLDSFYEGRGTLISGPFGSFQWRLKARSTAARSIGWLKVMLMASPGRTS